jgi:hypothetical protein
VTTSPAPHPIAVPDVPLARVEEVEADLCPLAFGVKQLMRLRFAAIHGADWTVAYSREEHAAAVVFRGQEPEGALPGVRRRHLTGWAHALTAAGFVVERRFDGPNGDDLEAPWWLHVTESAERVEARHARDPRDGDFISLAATHPEACTCDATYPGWAEQCAAREADNRKAQALKEAS